MAVPRICSIPSCDNPHRAKGLCGKHYQRQKMHGHPTEGGEEKGKQLRWIEKYKAYRGDDCVIWPYAFRSDGYGKFRLRARDPGTGAHRVMCIAAHGEPPSGTHVVAHSCGVPACTNPRHLRWATQRENSADMIGHGTVLRGESNGEAKLTANDVSEIRRLKGRVFQKDLAKRFAISQAQVSRIQRGESWASMPCVPTDAAIDTCIKPAPG